ncbi:hypothetical protein G9C98_008568, partial [Cotesia typhae]
SEVPLYLSSDPGKNEIAIAWQLDINEFNNCGNMKILTVCNYNQVLGLGYNGTNSSSSINITEDFIQRIITTTIKSLSPYTRYECFSITSNDHKKFSFIWKLPVYLPGHISKFEVNFTWYYKFHQPIWCSNFSSKSEYSIILNESTSSLSYEKAYPFSSYQASIRAKTLAGWSNYSDSVPFATHPGAPGPVSNLTYIFKKASDDATNLEAFLSWGLPCFINAVKIENFVVTGIGTRNNFPNHDLNTTITSQMCIDDICTVKLQLKDEYTYDFSVAGKVKDVKPLGAAKEIRLLYPAGDIETCPELSKIKVSYCNGPLNPDTWYDVRMRAFTDGGYRDSKIFQIKTNAELQVSLIIGSIVGILSVGVLITIFLLVKKCSVQTVLRRLLNSNMPGSPVPAPFNRRKFIIHCQQLADNPGKLSNEFQLLQTLSLDLQMPTNAGCLHANRKKNRYVDILPYDFSRVKLDIIDNDPNSDYINASFIKDEEKRIIVHLQFKDWPDYDVPEDFDAMINFCQIMKRNINTSRNLVVVHCSAGIGRTGTLIAIDIILQHLKDNRKLDVFGTVYRLRQQRINMVQRESQYTFIYNCIKQVLKNPHFSKSYKPPYGNQCVRPSYEDKSELKHSNVLTINQNESIELDTDAR